MRYLKSLLCVAMLSLASITLGAQPATYRDVAAWDSVSSTTNWLTIGYDVVLSRTNVTAAMLGTTNGVPTLSDVLGKSRLLGVTNTVAAFNSFLSTNPVPLPYTLWARTVANPAGMTNYVVSDWTNIVVNWVNLPPPPSGLRVQLLGP